MVKRERKVGSVLVERNALKKKRDSLWGRYTLSWAHSHMHMSSDMQMPQGKG